MSIAFSCPGCGKQFRVSDNMAGRKAKCSACATVMLVPGAEQGITSGPTPQAPPQQDEMFEQAPPPRKKKKRARMQSRTGLLLALLGLGGAILGSCLCCGGFAGLGYYGVWDPFGLFGGLPAESRYLPEHCQLVVVVNVEQLLESQAYKELRQEIPQMKDDTVNKNSPVPISNLVMVMSGAAGALPLNAEEVTIYKTKSEMGRTDIQNKISNGQPKLIKVKNYEIYASDKGQSFCFVDAKTLLVSRSAETLRRILERDSKPTFAANMKAALRKANFNKSISFAVDFDTFRAGMTGAGIGPRGPGPAGPLQNVNDIFMKSQAAGGYLHFGSGLDLSISVVCQDSKTAEDIKKLVDGLLTLAKGQGPESKEMIEPIKVDTRWSSVSIEASYPTATLVKFARSMKAKIPFLPFGLAKPPLDPPAVARADPPRHRDEEQAPVGQLCEWRQAALLLDRRRVA